MHNTDKVNENINLTCHAFPEETTSHEAIHLIHIRKKKSNYILATLY